MVSTAEERALKKLIAKKESLFLILQNLLDLSRNINTSANYDKFKLLYHSFSETRDNLISVIDEINDISLEIDAYFNPDYKILPTINEMCCHIQAVAAKIKATSAGATGTSVQVMDPNRVLPSLPKIELPEFGGEIRQWEVFYGIFKSLIHDNKTLNNTDKVHYLVGRLRGSALSVCSGIAPTGDNYEIIWRTLLDKYQDKRFLANSYLEQIINFRPLQSESSKNLNLFLEKFDVSVSALKKLNLPDLADFILFHQARNKLDSDTVKAFDAFKRGTAIPTYSDLVSFVKEQTKMLNINKPSGSNSAVQSVKPKMFAGHFRGDINKTKSTACILCKKHGHYLGRCEKFKSLSPVKRYEMVKDNNWCYNCLSSNHGVRACPSDRTCLECSKKHHILLHAGKIDGVQTKKEEDENESAFSQTNSVLCSTVGGVKNIHFNSETVLLSTAVVCVLNSPISNGTARFILDSGSQVNLLTINCCKKFALNIVKAYTSVQGLGQMSQTIRGKTDLIIGSRYDKNINFNISALLVEKITDKLPREKINCNSLCSEFNSLDLADNSFAEPGEIDGILGAELFPYIFGKNRRACVTGSPIALETVFGYVIMGKVPTLDYNSNLTFFTEQDGIAIEKLVHKFWEIEQVPNRTLPCPDDQECENIFNKTFSRDVVTGRFSVALPFKHAPKYLGDSKTSAQLRLLSLEKRFNRFPDLRLKYNQVIKDFIDQGHLRACDQEDSSDLSYYIAHHAVLKPESTSTPLRVVLDASAPSDTDISLNDILYSGPKLQADIFTLLLNFRLFKVAITSDIRQMYRQINITREHWKFQRILWRFGPEDKIDTYELGVVAFGVKSSPYLALRVVQQLVHDEKDKYPLAVAFINRDLYMNDLVSSVASLNEARQLYQESVQLFSAGCFELTKFSTNSQELIKFIPVNKRLTNEVIFKTETKILGMRWSPDSDSLTFNLDCPENKCTKRSILSAVARCYDPLGLISPFIFSLKLLVKELWKLKLPWDEQAPEHIRRAWEKIRQEWHVINCFKLPRHIGVEENHPITILAFADASQDGYGAVVYLKTIVSNIPVVRLLCAKSKVSPFKLVTIPRLELCAALLLSNLVKCVLNTYVSRTAILKTFAFSDSTTVISWLNSTYIKDIFVANRVSQIKENISEALWLHVEGINNPADCLSRGLTPSQLVNHPFWASGPAWLKYPETEWPVKLVFGEAEGITSSRKECAEILVVTDEPKSHPLLELAERCSSWQKTLRITVFVLRFLKIIPVNRQVTIIDLNRAELTLLKLVQLKHFYEDIKMMEKNKLNSTKLSKLQPFLKDGLLRVGGRLKNSSLSYFQKHPIILPAKDPLIEKLVDFHHKINLHTGPYLLEALLRQRYWIMGGRNLIRNRVHKCNHCFRIKPTNVAPLMADLPAERVLQAKAFLHTGVDYFGPMNITLGKKRGASVHKAYVCLFVCMSVKAIHLELVSSLSTAHFLQAFKRFLARRGPCKHLYSDQGSNFVGAKTVLREINNLVNSDEYKNTMRTQLAVEGVEWRFNTPYAPHQGGLWESNVKAVKNHIYRVIGQQLLTYEELSTLLTQIEALLNSRPLCRLSADSSAPEALTPAHFLTLMPLKGLPMEDLTHLKINRLDRFQLIDRMVQDFWKRWRSEYLTSLQIREKWFKTTDNVKAGTVVIVKYDNSPPLCWPLGVIVDVLPGKDGIVRNVRVKTNKGVFSRPVVKVCPLPSQ